jgi:DNA-binding NarL/FixJ family response regulator
MNWIKFNDTWEEMETFECGTVLMLDDGSTVMLGDLLYADYAIMYYSNELVNKIKGIRNIETVSIKDKNIEAIKLLANGYVRKQVAAEMKLHIRAFNERINQIRKTFGCKNITQLVYVLAKRDLI